MHTELQAAMSMLSATAADTGVLIIDHGSRRNESNELLHEVAETFEQLTEFELVSPAHMELAEPSIAAGFADLVGRGAKFVVAFPYFLSPGRHWKKDVPTLVAAAAKNHSGIKYVVTAPLGLHPLMIQIMTDRIATCLQQPENGCDVCQGNEPCRIIEIPR